MPAAEAIAAGAQRRAADRRAVFSSATRAQLGSIAANAPVQVAAKPDEPYTGPLKCDLYPTIVSVDVEWIDVQRPSVRNTDTRETPRAAVRAQLENATDYGPETHVAAMVVDGDTVKTVVLKGTVAAVRQAFPDQMTLVELAKAGAKEFVSWDLDQSQRRTVRRVGLFNAPKALQMELETRGLTALVRALAPATA